MRRYFSQLFLKSIHDLAVRAKVRIGKGHKAQGCDVDRQGFAMPQSAQVRAFYSRE